MSFDDTGKLTVNCPLVTTWIWGDEDEELEPLPPSPLLDEPSCDDDRPVPLADPVPDVAPDPPLPSCSPTVRLTEATVPSNVATSCAPASACCAFSSVSVAVWIDVWSADSCAADAPDV